MRCLLLAVILVTPPAFARDDGPWADRTPEVGRWFQQLMQPDHPRVSCCGDADAYEADDFEVEGDHYVAIITGHRAVTEVPVGTRIPVPNYKMKYDAGNPTGHGIIFLRGDLHVFCYVAPGGI